MASPFGFLIPPSAPLVPPELSMQTISPSSLVYNFPTAAIKSHIAVFLLPGQTLPVGSAAALYIQFPGQEFKFLGALGEGKASAVFRVAGLKPGGGDGGVGEAGGAGPNVQEVDMDADETPTPAAGSDQGTVTIGVSLEPADEVGAKLAQQRAEQGTASGASAGALVPRGTGGAGAGEGAGIQGQPGTKVLAQRIIKNAFNFLASYESGNGMVPIKAFEGWWQKFERKVENDPGFLEKEQD